MKHAIILVFISLALGCSEDPQTTDTTLAATPDTETASLGHVDKPDPHLLAILDQQTDDAKARYPFRKPAETLTLFDIKPGMTVAEVLPGQGWYSKILNPYLGSEGKLIGIGYSFEMAQNVFSPRYQALFKTFPIDWPKRMASTSKNEGASLAAYQFGAISDDLDESVDRVLFVRALHHLSRSRDHGDYYASALSEVYAMLKPGGKVGIVQHEAAESMSDAWAIGTAGYLKKSQVIQAFEKAGFVLRLDSDIHHNDQDQPDENDVVWRLPPSLRGADQDEALKAKMLAIGESHRMTLVFQKP